MCLVLTVTSKGIEDRIYICFAEIHLCGPVYMDQFEQIRSVKTHEVTQYELAITL